MLLPVEGHHLRTVELGRGTPLLLHSGWVASWELWLPTVERLQAAWRCLAYDQRGAGASTFPPEAISPQALVDDVFRVLDAHGVDRAVVAGESLGSMVVLRAVLQDPSRFLGLVMVGGRPRTDPHPPDGPDGPEAVRAAQKLRATLADWPAYLDAFVDACLPEPDAAGLHRFGVGTLLAAGPEAGARMSEVHRGIAPDLAAVAVPALVIHGTADAVAPLADGRELAAGLPDSELVVLEGAGHVPIVTRPDAVADALNAWWDRVARPVP